MKQKYKIYQQYLLQVHSNKLTKEYIIQNDKNSKYKSKKRLQLDMQTSKKISVRKSRQLCIDFHK